MKHASHWRRGLFALALSAVVAPALAVTQPSQDPFYRQPATMPSVPPGTILETRPVSHVLPVAATATQLKFVTTDHKNRPVVAIATLIVPDAPAAQTPRPLLAYNFAIDSLYLDCNPSYVLQGGLSNENGSTSYGAAAEMALFTPLLEQGWAVVVSDYEGLTMHWTVGKMAAHGVLDAIRAARRYAPARLSASPVAMWGYSGGAQATIWAAEQAPSYAPELYFKGVAAGGVPVDLMTIARKVDGGSMAGIELAAIMAQIDAWPEYKLSSILNDAGRQLQQQVHQECIGQYVSNYANQRLQDYSSVTDPLSLPVAKEVTDKSRLGQARPMGPLYIYQGAQDEAIPYADVNALVNQYCSQGVKVTYNLDGQSAVQEHYAYSATGAPGALIFLETAMANLPLPSTCGLPTSGGNAGSGGACNYADPTTWGSCGSGY